MTTQHTQASEARAADSGAQASARFKDRAASGQSDQPVDHERVDLLATKAVKGITDLIYEEKVSYAEYNALKAWLIKVGEDGEWPLFLDVWIEHAVEDVATEHRDGSKGTIEGPYYVENAPEQQWDGVMPMRNDEPGTPFRFKSSVTDVDGNPLPDAKIEMWHADEYGLYSQFAPGIPEWNLRATFLANEDGEFDISTIRPAPYQIPTEGACGQLIAAANWHAWRPAHIHVKVSAPGYELLTAQLYFPGDEHNDDDIASAVKPELMLDPQPAADGNGEQVQYDFRLDPER